MTVRTSMHAVVVDGPGVVRLTEVPKPEPGPGEALVSVEAAGLCGSDLELLDGRRPAQFVRYPVVPGHEWSGRVAAVGPRVSAVALGDLVVAEGIRGCGRCDRCRAGESNLCTTGYAETGFTHPGAFAEFVCVPERLLHRLPETADPEHAALLEPAACACSGLARVDLRVGQAVAVVGAGTLGLLATSILRSTFPRRLALLGTRAERLEAGRRSGATETWDARDGGTIQRLEAEFDLVFEAANRPEGAASAVRLARRGGTVVLAGISGAGLATIDPDAIALRQLRLQGVFGATADGWQWAIQLFAAGMLEARHLATHRFGLADFERAVATARDPAARAIKVLVTRHAMAATSRARARALASTGSRPT
ncbi:MAG TPA: alcohol dehydrogenase catalytic domain-containing protein [Candidatus Limnocylindria bacterium]|nr:alcohol dehydrogenase catalytic domain-containing protein [Candidatus Limnocylindria bacterium]